MNKAVNQLREKSRVELEKMEREDRKALAVAQVESRTNPPKDSNTKSKNRKELARILTIKNSKKE